MSNSWLTRYSIPMAVDAVLVAVSYGVSLLLRFDGSIPAYYLQSFGVVVLPIAIVYCCITYLFGLYRRMWRYASSMEVTAIFGAIGVSATLLGAADFFWSGTRPLPLSVMFMGGMLSLGALTAVRYRARLLTGFLWRWRAAAHGYGSRVLIVGAGEEAQLLAWRLKSQGDGYYVVGFIDDDPSKQGMNIHGSRVLGGRGELEALTLSENVDNIIIAIDKVSGKDVQEIVGLCERTLAKVKIVPDLFDLMEGNGSQPLVRDLTVEDLLGRESIPVDQEACRRLIHGRVVLVTGASGSIGSELCRQICQFEPALLIMLDNNETGLHDLALELRHVRDTLRYQIVVGDILREKRLEHLLATERPHIVFHCAAYKHVPLLEENHTEAVLVNIRGTQLVTELAWKYHVDRFVFISTDKAVSPSSVMGATKLFGELLTQSLPPNGHSHFTVVRFGNVLNSRGSVVPVFTKQIDMGGPVTVTSEGMTRFFMGLPEAVSLVIQAASFTQGSDLFMLNMGQPIRISELARKLIRLRGLRVGEDIQIVHTGIRPGEKVNEDLVGSDEERQATPHPYIYRLINNCSIDCTALKEEVCRLVELAENDQVEELLERLIRNRASFDHAGVESRVGLMPMPFQ